MRLCFVLQSESEQQVKPDDQWESVNLLLADADETRLHHHGRPDRHPHIPDNHRELHPPVHVLLLQSAPGRRPPRLAHLHPLQWRNLSLLVHDRGLLVLTSSVPSSLRPPRHPSRHPALRASHSPSPPSAPPPSSSPPVPTPLATSPPSVTNPGPASTFPAPSSPPRRTAYTVNTASRETGNKEDYQLMRGLRRSLEKMKDEMSTVRRQSFWDAVSTGRNWHLWEGRGHFSPLCFWKNGPTGGDIEEPVN